MHICLIMSQRDNSAGGHVPAYAVAICNSAFEAGWSVSLCGNETLCHAVTSNLKYLGIEGVVDVHSDPPSRVRAVPSGELSLLLDQLRVYRDLQRIWQAFARQGSADWVHLLNGDDCVFGIAALGSPCGNVPVSLVLFHDYFSTCSGNYVAPASSSRRLLRRVGLWGVLHQGTVGAVFSTNTLLQTAWQRHIPKTGVDVAFLQEIGPNWPHLPSRTIARDSLHIASDRQVILCYGCLDSRKNISYLLDLLKRDRGGRLTGLIVGPISSESDSLLGQSAHLALQQDRKLIVLPGYALLETESIAFAAADATWVAYKGFLGPSAVLELGCAASTPLIGSIFGVVGDTIQKEHLGVCIPGTSLEEDYTEVLRLMNDTQLRDDASRACRVHASRHGRVSWGQEICSSISAELARRAGPTSAVAR